MLIDNKAALITGGCQGIGAALSQLDEMFKKAPMFSLGTSIKVTEKY